MYNFFHCFRTAKVVVYAIKAHRGGRGTAPLILNLSINVTATLRLEKEPQVATEHEPGWSPNMT